MLVKQRISLAHPHTPPPYSNFHTYIVRTTHRAECWDRARAIVARIRRLATSDGADTLVLVSHGDLMDALTKCFAMAPNGSAGTALTARERDHCCRYVHTNTGISRIEVGRADGAAHIMSLNETPHLAASAGLLTGGEMVNGWGKWRRKPWAGPQEVSSSEPPAARFSGFWFGFLGCSVVGAAGLLAYCRAVRSRR